MRQVLRSRKGFTLVEVTVAFVLLSILIVVSGAIILSALSMYSRSAASAQAQRLGDSVYDFVSDRLTYAQHIEIGSDTEGYAQSILISDGVASYRQTADGEYRPIADTTLYGATVSLETQVDGTVMTLTVTVSYGSRNTYERSSSFRLINVETMDGGSVTGTVGLLSNPAVFFD